jgi:hypothetical protein
MIHADRAGDIPEQHTMDLLRFHRHCASERNGAQRRFSLVLICLSVSTQLIWGDDARLFPILVLSDGGVEGEERQEPEPFSQSL